MALEATTEPVSIGKQRREVEAVVLDGWTACGGCATRFGYGITAAEPGAKVKCYRCSAWVLLGPVLRDRVSRRI